MIVEAEAAVIREIMRRYAAGESTREIAADLNARGVPGPRGGHWNASTISGSASRRNGILHAELYAGVKVWNRMEVIRDPDTGKRLPKLKPEAQWRRTPVPALRIVSDELWSAVRSKTCISRQQSPGQISAARKGFLSGLVKCGCCGASYTSYSKTRLACAANRERGPVVCKNGHKANRAAIEHRVLEGLRTRLASPEAAAVYVREYASALAELVAEGKQRQQPLEQRLAELKRRIARLVDDVCEGRSSPALRAKLAELEDEQARVKGELEAETGVAPPTIALHPSVPDRYAELISDLRATLAEAAGDKNARPLVDAVRGLIIRVEVSPDSSAPDGVRIELVGDLAPFMDEPGGRAPLLGVHARSWGRDRTADLWVMNPPL